MWGLVGHFGFEWRTDVGDRIWRDLRGEEDPFEGMGNQSFRTRSSVTAPIFKVDPFNVKNGHDANNEVAVIDDDHAPNSDDHVPPPRNSNDHILPPPPPMTMCAEDDEEDWSDVSI